MSQIQQKINFYQTLDKIVDLFLIFLSIFMAIISENYFHGNAILSYNPESFTLLAFPLTTLITFCLIIYIERFFIYRITTYSIIIKNIIKVVIFLLFIILFLDFIFKAELFYRTTILFFAIFIFINLIIKRLIFKKYLSNLRSRGKDVKNIVVIGCNNNTTKFIKNINDHKEFGFKVSAIIYENEEIEKIPNYDYIHIDNINTLLLEHSIDEVFIINIDNDAIAKEIVNKLENMGLNYHIVIDVDKFNRFENSEVVPVIDRLYNFPTISFYSSNATYYKLVIKNFIERLFALILFLLTSPILLLSIMIIFSTSKGNPIFIQTRVGLRNRKFKQYKLRTMFIDAEEKKVHLLDKNEHLGPVFKITNDPRITWIGKLLRKYSIDELPQLINVLKGDMNLIGPRPPVPEEVKKYKTSYYRRFTFKPGITGLWQISGRNDIKDFEDWIKLDLEYIDNWSLKNDFIIALKTIPAILKGTGK